MQELYSYTYSNASIFFCTNAPCATTRPGGGLRVQQRSLDRYFARSISPAEDLHVSRRPRSHALPTTRRATNQEPSALIPHTQHQPSTVTRDSCANPSRRIPEQLYRARRNGWARPCRGCGLRSCRRATRSTPKVIDLQHLNFVLPAEADHAEQEGHVDAQRG